MDENHNITIQLSGFRTRKIQFSTIKYSAINWLNDFISIFLPRRSDHV